MDYKLIEAARNAYLKIKSTERSHAIIKLKDHAEINSIAFSPDGKLIATGGFSTKDISIWDIESNEKIKSLKKSWSSSLDNTVKWSSSNLIAAISDGHSVVNVWAANKDFSFIINIDLVRFGKIRDISFNHDGSKLLIACNSGSLKSAQNIFVYDTKSWERKEIKIGIIVNKVAWYGDKIIAVGNNLGEEKGFVLKLVDISARSEKSFFITHEGTENPVIDINRNILAISVTTKPYEYDPANNIKTPMLYVVDLDSLYVIKEINMESMSVITSIRFISKDELFILDQSKKPLNKLNINTNNKDSIPLDKARMSCGGFDLFEDKFCISSSDDVSLYKLRS